MRKVKSVLLVGAECAPFAKTGGLADVIGTLPSALKKQGIEASVMMPLHRQIKEKYRFELYHLCTFYVTLGWRRQFCGIERLVRDGITYYFVDNEFYFGGPIYKGGAEEGEQFAFFSRAVLEALSILNLKPDVIHVNDWHTAMIPMLLKTQYFASMGDVKTVLTIHNIAYQGKFSFEFVNDLLGIPPYYYTSEFIESYGSANFLKAGIVFADKVNTVSPTYAKELKYPYYSEGLDGVLASRDNDFCGIINGIDEKTFDPETDDKIAAKYSAKTIENKLICKKVLTHELSLTGGEDIPLLSVVSRLTEQKGLDLIIYALDEIMEQNVNMVVLGSGDKKYEDFFKNAAEKYPDRLSFINKYDDELSHRIYAASDLFLMPSKFEPCGISQMIAIRYGALPIVRETGGLKDTVKSYNELTGEGTGFSFADYNGDDFLFTVKRAINLFSDKKTFKGIVRRAMSEDFSFNSSAKKYLSLYESCF